MLQADNICFNRGATAVLDKVSFTLRPAELIKIVGANGSGKTTLLKILCRLLTPDSGMLYWRDSPIKDNSEQYHEEMLYIGHKHALADELTPLENLHAAAALRQRPPRLTADAALAAAALPPRCRQQHCRYLSAGQKRRAALARLQAFTATLWLLDEPLAALDNDGTAIIEHWLQQHLQNGGMAICAMHHAGHTRLPAAATLEI